MNISTATLNRLHLSKTGVYESFISPVEAQALVAMIESTDRAWWWEKVEVGYEFRESEPLRREADQDAEEYLAPLPFTIIATNVTYFRDTRWTPPMPPPQVGDEIETEEQAASLPVGTIAVSITNEPIRKVGVNEWRLVNAGRSPLIVDCDG